MILASAPCAARHWAVEIRDQAAPERRLSRSPPGIQTRATDADRPRRVAARPLRSRQAAASLRRQRLLPPSRNLVLPLPAQQTPDEAREVVHDGEDRRDVQQ